MACPELVAHDVRALTGKEPFLPAAETMEELQALPVVKGVEGRSRNRDPRAVRRPTSQDVPGSNASPEIGAAARKASAAGPVAKIRGFRRNAA